MANPLVFAMALTALAGWVDATSFIHFHRLFVSFVSGNTTQGAVAVAHADTPRAFELARTVLLFVLGAASSEFVASFSRRWSHSAALFFELVVLGATFLAASLALNEWLLTSGLAFAMGAQNAVMHRAGEVSVSATYITGTLVLAGRRLAGVFRGTQPWHAPLPFIAMWLGMILGGIGGAFVADHSLLLALACALAFCAIFLGWALIAAARAPADGTK